MTANVLMVVRNNAPLTKRAVQSVLRQDMEDLNLVVIDNASSDGIGQWLKTKDLILVSYPQPRALAACWNHGIRTFWRVGGDKVLVINNDVELPTYFYSALQSRCGGSRPFVTGISVSARAQVPPVVPINFYHNETDHPDFSAFMLTKEVTDRVGWFDEKYRGAYFEDGDMHVRMHRAGIRAVSYNLPFYHERSSTLKNAGRAEQNRINRAFDINKETFKRKYGCYPGTPEYDQLFA